MKYFKISILVILIVVLCGCIDTTSKLHIEDIDFYSNILKKNMKLKVYFPPDYNDDTNYPVLYFFPDWGGSVYTIMNDYAIAEKAEKLILNDEITPLIIVAVDIDRSFGVNSADEVETVTTPGEKQFEKGMYKDYFCKEIIPYIDEQYSTISSKEGRYIGGYSMGGFAALHIAFCDFELFSKVGGHSPSIFIDDFPDETVTEFLYPTEEIRENRDPVRIVQNQKIEDLQVFLDVEIGGSAGVKYLYDILIENNVDATYQELSLSHSRFSCYQNMDTYLLFYAGK